MTALEIAIAKIEAQGRASAARLARIEADSRIKFLTAVYAQNSDTITGYGFAGFAQMGDSLSSARRIRKMRAEALLGARTAQIDGRDGYLRKCLTKAAALRREGTHRRRVEECEAHLAGVDAALAVASETLAVA